MSDHNHDSVEPSYLVAKKGILSWLITVDHKRIGLMYLAATLFFFLVAGLLAIALRTEPLRLRALRPTVGVLA